MTNILKFQPKGALAREKKEWIGQIAFTMHVQTDILDDGSVWYRIGSQFFWDKEIVWDEWRKIDD